MTDILCQFCGRGENETEICGKLWRNKNSRGKPCAAHLRCMEFSSNLSQYEFYSFGGFLVDEVRAEVSRAEHLKCWVCGGYGASAGCALSSCNKSFHYYCATVSDDCCVCTIQLRANEQLIPTNSINRSTSELSSVNIYSIFCSKNHRTEFLKSTEDLHKVISEFQKFDLKNGGSVASPTNSGKVCADVNNVAPSVSQTLPSQISNSCKYPSDSSFSGSSKSVAQIGSSSAAISSLLTSSVEGGENENTGIQQERKSAKICLNDEIPCSSHSATSGQICLEATNGKLVEQTDTKDGFSERLKRKKAEQRQFGMVSSGVQNSRKFRKRSEISEESDSEVRIGQKSERVSKCPIEDESRPNIINKRKSGIEKDINILNYYYNATTSGVETEKSISYSTCRNLQLSADMCNDVTNNHFSEQSSHENMDTSAEDNSVVAEVRGLQSQLLNTHSVKLNTCKFFQNNTATNSQKITGHRLCRCTARACTAEVENDCDMFAAAICVEPDVLQSSDDGSDNDDYHEDNDDDGRPWWWLPPTAPTPPSCSSTEDKSRGLSPGVLSNCSSPVSLFGSDCDVDDNSNDETKNDNSRNVEVCHSAGVNSGKESGPLLSNTSSNINNNEIDTKCTNRCDNNKVCHILKSPDRDYLNDLELSSDSDRSTDSDYSCSVNKGKHSTEKRIIKNERKVDRDIVHSKSDLYCNGKININCGGESGSELNPQKKYNGSKSHSEGFCNDSYCGNDKECQHSVTTKNGAFGDQNVSRSNNDGKGDCIRNHISYQKLPIQSCHSDGELSSTANNCEYDTKLLLLHNNDSAQYNAENTNASTINENKVIQENIVDDISLIQKFLDDNFVICKGRLNECSNRSQLCVNGENPETDAQNLTFPSSELPSPCKSDHLSDNNVGEGMRVIGRILGTDKVSDIEDQKDGERGKCTSSVVVLSNTHCSSNIFEGKESNVSNNLNSDEELLSDGARCERDFNSADVTDRETSDTSVEVVRKVQRRYTKLISSTEDDDDDDDDDIGFTRVNRRNQLCFTKQQQNVLHSSRKRTIKRISAASEQSDNEYRADAVSNYLDTTDTSVEDECEMRNRISSTDGDTSISCEDISQACKNEMINKNQQQHVVSNTKKRLEIQNEFKHPVGSSNKIFITNNLGVNALNENCAGSKLDQSDKDAVHCDRPLHSRQIKCVPKLYKNNQSVNHRASHTLLAQRIQPTLRYLQRESFHQEKEEFTELQGTVSPSVTGPDHAYVLCLPLFSDFKKEMINSVLAESENLVNNAGGIKDFCTLIWMPDQVNSCDESSCECHTSSSGSQLVFTSRFVSCFDRPSQFSSTSANSADSQKSKSKPSVTGVNGLNRRLNLGQSNMSTLAAENENDSIITNGVSNANSAMLSGLRCDVESHGAKQGELSSRGSKKCLQKDINKARLALEALAAYTECLKEGDGYQSLVERLDGNIHCCTEERKVLHERIESNLKLAKDRFKVKVGCVELVEISSSLSLFGFLLLLDSCDSINSLSRCRSLKQPFSLFNCPDSCRFISDSRARHHEFESLWRCVESEYQDASILIRPDQLITSSSSSQSSVASLLAARLVERLRGIRDEGPFLFVLLRTDSEVVRSYLEFLKGWFRLISEEFLTGCRDVCVIFDVGSRTLSCGDSDSSSKLSKSPDVSSKPQTKSCATELSVQDLNGSSVNYNTVPKLSPPNDGTMKNNDKSSLQCVQDQNTIHDKRVIAKEASSNKIKSENDITSAQELLDLIDSSIDTSTVKVELHCGVDPECNNVSCIMLHMTLLH